MHLGGSDVNSQKQPSAPCDWEGGGLWLFQCPPCSEGPSGGLTCLSPLDCCYPGTSLSGTFSLCKMQAAQG